MNSFVKNLLYPFLLFYGIVVFIRNKCYDLNILKSTKYNIPVISVGNITVGGTGKTPHVEYLIHFLKDKFKLAYLSRGYKRKTNDFLMANNQSTADIIGDEPYQIMKKFDSITVAVDNNRVNGINKLIDHFPDLDIVLLDDAFQHRSVYPGINILLVDYNRPIFEDTLLPVGRLRESASESKRADIIIITKTPHNINPMEKRLFLNHLDPQSHQKVFFSTIKYGEPRNVFSDNNESTEVDFMGRDISILLVTGIADNSHLLKQLNEGYNEVIPIAFADHYQFTQSDILSIENQFDTIRNTNKVILTTEKDAARLSTSNHIISNANNWFYIPIEIEFLANEGEQFNKHILHYVNNNSRNSILYKK